jgi:hypothetical protein
MKNVYFLVFAALFWGSCSQEKEQSSQIQMAYFGAEFDPTSATDVATAQEMFFQGKASEFILKGKVEEVCQKKGCWMKLQAPNGKTMHVKFKDYEFFVPMDIAGKEVVMKGIASYDTVSVKYLRHLAEDAKKSAEEIEKITEPEIWTAFEAEGVVVLDYSQPEEKK